MAVNNTGETALSPSDLPSAAPRPSWETARSAPRSAAASAVPAARSLPPSAPSAAPVSLPPFQPLGETVRYDLAGNPIASSSPSPSAYAPPTAYAPSQGYAPQAGTWPPAPTAGRLPGVASNDSGSLATVPAEISGKIWNWGAFCFPILWLKKHNMTTLASMIGACLAVPRMLHTYVPSMHYVNLIALLGVVIYWVVRIYFGFTGHSYAWRNRHFPGGVAEHFQVQRAWMLWGLGLFALDVALMIFVVGPVLMSGSEPRALDRDPAHLNRPLISPESSDGTDSGTNGTGFASPSEGSQ